MNDLKEVKGAEHAFELTNPKPIFARQYHLAHREQEFSETWVKELEEAGIVREVESPFAAPVVVAPKKDEGGQWTDLRYAIDYMRLNALTVRDQYPTPVPEKISVKMDGATLFTIMDAKKGVPPSRRCRRDSAAFGVSLGQPLNDLESNAIWRKEIGCVLATSGG